MAFRPARSAWTVGSVTACSSLARTSRTSRRSVPPETSKARPKTPAPVIADVLREVLALQPVEVASREGREGFRTKSSFGCSTSTPTMFDGIAPSSRRPAGPSRTSTNQIGHRDTGVSWPARSCREAPRQPGGTCSTSGKQPGARTITIYGCTNSRLLGLHKWRTDGGG